MAMFFRDGSPAPSSLVPDSKGRAATTIILRGGRCGGAGGSEKWRATGFVCFDCNGSGDGKPKTVPVYTAERLARLNTIGDRAQARRDAAAREKATVAANDVAARRVEFETMNANLLAEMGAFAERNTFIADVLEKALARAAITPGQVEAVRSSIARMRAADAIKVSSGWVASPGVRIQASVTVERVSSFERAKFGADWLTEMVWIVSMRDEDGNTLVSKTPSFRRAVGDQIAIKATVKEHTEFRGEKQTVVQRIAVVSAKTLVAA